MVVQCALMKVWSRCIFPYQDPIFWRWFSTQAFHRSWSITHDVDGISFIYVGWSEILSTTHENIWLTFFLSYKYWLRVSLVAVAGFEWYPHGILLWDSDVSLHMAQCDREFKSYHQVSPPLPLPVPYGVSRDITAGQSLWLFVLILLQAYFCNIIIYRRDCYFSLCWHGCSGYRKMEIC